MEPKNKKVIYEKMNDIYFISEMDVYDDKLEFVVCPSIKKAREISILDGVIFDCEVENRVVGFGEKKYVKIPNIGQFLIGIRFPCRAKNIQLMTPDLILATWRSAYYIDFASPIPLFEKGLYLFYEDTEPDLIFIYADTFLKKEYGNKEPILINISDELNYYVGMVYDMITIVPKTYDIT